MFFKKDKEVKCCKCCKQIKGGEKVFLVLRYPSYDGMVRIKKFIENEGQVFCEDCSKSLLKKE